MHNYHQNPFKFIEILINPIIPGSSTVDIETVKVNVSGIPYELFVSIPFPEILLKKLFALDKKYHLLPRDATKFRFDVPGAFSVGDPELFVAVMDFDKITPRDIYNRICVCARFFCGAKKPDYCNLMFSCSLVHLASYLNTFRDVYRMYYYKVRDLYIAEEQNVLDLPF